MSNPSFNDIAGVIESIPGETLGGDQPEFLFRLSLGQKISGSVVEIGTNVGKSAIALAFAEKCRGGGKIVTVDIYEHPDVQKNLRVAGVGSFVRRIVEPSRVAARNWSSPIRLLWIDGDHSRRGVLNDIQGWVPWVVPGGLVALHDYPGHTGSNVVRRAIRKSVLDDPGRFRILSDRAVGSIIVFQRMASSRLERPAKAAPGYWRWRELRSWIVQTFPAISQRRIRRIKERGKPERTDQ